MNKMSKIICKDIPTYTSGIYRITNIKTGQHYIGLSNNCRERLLRHTLLLRNNQHGNKHLQNSFNKYGNENFTYHLVEACKKSQLYKKEIYYTEKFNSMTPNGFNICKPGRSRKEGPFTGFINSSRCKTFEVISPDEQVYTVNVCSTFAKDHPSVTASQLRCLKRKDYTHADSGWRIKGAPKIKPSLPGKEDIYVKDMNGKVYHVTHIKNFEIEHDIPKTTIYNLKNKRFKQHNGWSIDWSKTDSLKLKCKQWDKVKQAKYWDNYYNLHYRNKKKHSTTPS